MSYIAHIFLIEKKNCNPSNGVTALYSFPVRICICRCIMRSIHIYALAFSHCKILKFQLTPTHQHRRVECIYTLLISCRRHPTPMIFFHHIFLLVIIFFTYIHILLLNPSLLYVSRNNNATIQQ